MGVKIVPISPTYSGNKLKAVEMLQRALQTGLAGEGLAPDITSGEFQERRRTLGEEYDASRRELESSLTRTIPTADIGLKQYYRNYLKSKYAGGLNELQKEQNVAGFEDIGAARNLALGFLGGEIGTASDMSAIANQAAMSKLNMPSFSSELATGLGGAAGMYLANSLKGRQNQMGFPDTMNPVGFTGSQYMRSWAPGRAVTPTISPLVKYARQFSGQNAFWPM